VKQQPNEVSRRFSSSSYLLFLSGRTASQESLGRLCCAIFGGVERIWPQLVAALDRFMFVKFVTELVYRLLLHFFTRMDDILFLNLSTRMDDGR
jgi:hypothetical protein